ncbi:MAG: phospholipase D-like domain-containing protein [bacterium]
MENAKLIWNSRRHSLKEAFKSVLEKNKVDELWIAVAYFRKSGMEQIKEIVEAVLKRNGSVKIFIGTGFYHSEPTAVSNLKTKFKKYRRFKVLFVKDYRGSFHPKMYRFVHGKRETVFVGSSNVSGGGMSGNIEANIQVIVDRGDGLCKDMEKAFDEIENESACADKSLLKKYEAAHKEHCKAVTYNKDAGKEARREFKEEMKKRTLKKVTGKKKPKRELKKGGEAKMKKQRELRKKYREKGNEATRELFDEVEKRIFRIDKKIVWNIGNKASCISYKRPGDNVFAYINVRKKGLGCKVYVGSGKMKGVTTIAKKKHWGSFNIGERSDTSIDDAEAKLRWSYRKMKNAMRDGVSTS